MSAVDVSLVQQSLRRKLDKKKEKKAKKETKKEKKVDKSDPTKFCTLFGQTLQINRYVRVNIGPIIGKVTTNSAIILLEVNNEAPVTVFLVPRGGGEVVSTTEDMPRNVPKAFDLQGLSPDTLYDVVFSGISKKAIFNRVGSVRTFPTVIKKLSIAALSCDRPERVLDGETNMWSLLEEKVKNNEVQIVLHLGDQVYGQKELVDAYVILRQAKQDGFLTPETFNAVSYKVLGRLSDIYRFTWNLRRTAQTLANGSHLMIWSDNDLYNDFTVAKDEANKNSALSNAMIHYGHLAYRAYQRQLWDPQFEENPLQNADEFHYHKYGPVAVLMLDMRGNRIDWLGNQHIENPLLNEAQWRVINSAFNDAEIKVILVCSEIPFVSDPPEVAKKNAEKIEFLKDHWSYNSSELIKLLEVAFNWKAQGNGKREVVFIGGDIHVGAESEIFDNQTNLSCKHLTATPITNHVCKFFPDLKGNVNERFSYTHTPVETRNYGLIDITFDDDGTPQVHSRLIRDPHPVAHS